MQPLPFGINFSELLNIQKRDCPLLGPSLRNSWPSPLPHLPQDTWQHKEGVTSGLSQHELCYEKQAFFLPLPERFRTVTLKAPRRSLRLDTLSSWMVSVKAGQGEECSYLARLENSS